MTNYFLFGDHSTHDFSMHIEKFPALKGATRKRTTISVAGRNGDLHYTEDAYTNFQQQYSCYFHGARPAPEMTHAIRSWLQRSGEYLRLEDSYDPDHFHIATYIGPLDVENHLNKYGRCTVTFDCAPQAFLKSGEHPKSFATAGKLLNPTDFTALPMITVYGAGAGAVTIGSFTVEIKAITDHIILDCDLQHAYRQQSAGTVENMNSSIYAPDFPKLVPGENTIELSGDVTKIEIIPRWWEL